MDTSDTSAPGEPGRSSDSEAAEPRRCGAPTKKGSRCRHKVKPGGRCPLHTIKSGPQAAPACEPAAGEAQAAAPAEDAELQALRELEEAATDHARDAHEAIAHGENGDKDAAFNRNARTAAALARTRRALKPKAKDEAKQSDVAIYNEPDNERGDAAPPADEKK